MTLRVHVGPSGTSCAEELRHLDPLYGDVCDRKMLRSLVDGADVVVHLAGPASVSASFDDPVSCVTAHTAGTAAVLEACRDAKVQRIVYISSAEVRQRDVKSGCRGRAFGPAVSAWGSQDRRRGTRSFVSAWCMALISASSDCFPYGPGQNDRSVLSSIIRQARTSGTIRLFDLTPPRLGYVADVATAIWASIAHARRLGAGRTFNVGYGRGNHRGRSRSDRIVCPVPGDSS